MRRRSDTHPEQRCSSLFRTPEALDDQCMTEAGETISGLSFIIFWKRFQKMIENVSDLCYDRFVKGFYAHRTDMKTRGICMTARIKRIAAGLIALMMTAALFVGILPMGTTPVKAADGPVIRLHYHRPDGNYDGWDVWFWELGKEGAGYAFSDVNGEKVIQLGKNDSAEAGQRMSMRTSSSTSPSL